MSEYTQRIEDMLRLDANSTQNVGINIKLALRELDDIRKDNVFAARLYLMRYIEKKAISVHDNGTYTVLNAEGQECVFRKLESIKSVADMSVKDLKPYVDWLTAEAKKNTCVNSQSKSELQNNDFKEVMEALFVRHSWRRRVDPNKQEYEDIPFDRRCAYELGHMLGFEYKEMQAFIARVLKDELLLTKNARDLVETYCFSHGKSAETAKALLADYENQSAEKPLDSDLVEEDTKSLNEIASSFQDNDNAFINWLVQHGDMLDQLSNSAFTVYSNLLVCAYLLLIVYDEKYYMHGKDVKALQSAFLELDPILYHCKANGFYDKATEYAVTVYQEKNNYEITGRTNRTLYDHIIADLISKDNRMKNKRKNKKGNETRERKISTIKRNLKKREFFRNPETDKLINDEIIYKLWKKCISDKEDMIEYLNSIHDLFFIPTFSRINWKSVASYFKKTVEMLPTESKLVSVPRDFLYYLSVNEKGRKKVDNTFSRIPMLMNREEEITKKDVLCLIWLIYTFTFGNTSPSSKKDESPEDNIKDFMDYASGMLEEANFQFYAPALLEFSILRSLIIQEDVGDVYNTLIRSGKYPLLCKDIYIRVDDKTEYGIRFYGCFQSGDTVESLLHDYSEAIKKMSYTSKWKRIESIVTATAKTMDCGWEWFKAGKKKPKANCSFVMNEEGLICRLKE